MGVSKRIEHTLHTPATLWNAFANEQTPAEAARALGWHSRQSRVRAAAAVLSLGWRAHATLVATRPPSSPDVSGRRQAHRARSRHACTICSASANEQATSKAAGALGLQSTVTGEPCLRCRVPAMACQLRRLVQRARHRAETWLGGGERGEHALGTPAALWSASANAMATAEAAGALGLQSMVTGEP